MLNRLAVVLFLCSPAALAKLQVQPDDPSGGLAPRAAVADFQELHGAQWSASFREETGTLRHVFGGQLSAQQLGITVDGSPDSYEAAARTAVEGLSGALGFGSDTLEVARVKDLDLSRIGSSDKTVVKFRQALDGVQVWDGWVNVLLSREGALLSLDSRGLPGLERVDLAPSIPESVAAGAALSAFEDETGKTPVAFRFEDFVVFPAPVMAGKPQVVAAAAFVFIVSAAFDPTNGELPVVRGYAIAANPATLAGAPAVYQSWSEVHTADVTGTVSGWASPGLFPDDTYNPETLQALPDVQLTAPGQTAKFSSATGAFTFPGVVSPISVTATLDGVYSRVVNVAGANASVSASFTPGVPGSLTLNGAMTEQVTAQLNAHVSVAAMRAWLKSVDPSETSFDFEVVSNVNLSSTCNAFYDGISVNYYLSGGGCPNTAFSTIAWHEEGHWANDIYGSFNGSDGFGEGGADIWAMYIADNPIVGDGFFGQGTNIRSGLNTNPFCGDSNPACYGEVHADGEPLMGAIWKVRDQLETTLGAGPGADAANLLMVSWFQAYNDGQIKSVIEEHWLALDDDDGNMNNGTPHYVPIDNGFVLQSFPGFDLPLFNFAHTPVTSVNHENPIAVSATIAPENGVPVSASIRYSNNGGTSYATAAMAPQGGNVWSGQIPGQNSPAVVLYYLEAKDAANNTNTFPKKAPQDSFTFDVGELEVVQLYTFEPVSDQGWTHVNINGVQDDWHHFDPKGKSTDPSVAYSGLNVWGNDLGPDGWNGSYMPNVNNALLSPTFNLSGQQDVRLRFRRQLGVEKGIYDNAEIFVNNSLVWTNPSGTDLIDQGWVPFDLDISALADNNPSVQVKFEMTSDPGVEMGGWTIDDFALVSLGPATGGAFASYGAGTAGTNGFVPLLTGTGTATPNSAVTITTTNAKANTVGALFLGTSQASIPALGGTFLVGGLLNLQLNLITSGTGAVAIGGVLPGNAVVGLTVYMQSWFSDPAGPKGKSASNGLSMTVQ